jgi:transcriptional regulator with XRE-family HTH domain
LPRRRNYSPPAEERLIGSRLKELRLRSGMMQKALAKKLDMDQSVLSRYERGELRLPGSLVASIARVLKVSSDEILGLQEIKRGAPIKDQRFLRRIEAIDALPRRQKDALLTTIDGLIKSAKAS